MKLSLATLLIWLGAASATAAEIPFPADVAAAREKALSAYGALAGTWVEHGGIELVIGGASHEKIQSRWGHLSLRFKGSGATALDDVTLEMLAFTGEDSGEQIVRFGATGHYAIAPLVQSLGQLIRSYYYDEARGYARIIVPSRAEDRRALLQTLRMHTTQRTGSERYYFFSNNCVSALAKIFDQAGFKQRPLPYPFSPKRAAEHLRRSFLSPWPEVGGVSIAQLRRLHLATLDQFPMMSTLELQRLVIFRGLTAGEAYLRASEALTARTDFASAEDVFGIKPLPDAFYQATPEALAAINRVDLLDQFTEISLGHAHRANLVALNALSTPAFCRRKATRRCGHFVAVQAKLSR